MKRKIRTPQEKKVLSYALDRRNGVAESRGIAHRAIAKRKAGANQALRHGVKDKLITGFRQVSEVEDLDPFVARVGRRSWRKKPDQSLAAYLERKIQSRPKRGMSSNAKRSGLLSLGKRRAGKRHVVPE